MSDADLVDRMAALYDESTWADAARWDVVSNTDGICWGAKTVDGVCDLVFRGSKTPLDWFRDLVVGPHEFTQLSAIGHVHAGAAEGLPAMLEVFRTYWDAKGRPPIRVLGHSLGAMRAWIAAALLHAQGVDVERIVCCGSPRPGLADFAAYIAGMRCAAASYRNGRDPVCAVPFTLPGLDYVEPAPFTMVDVPPPATDCGVFAWHHIALYQQGVRALLKGKETT